MEDVVHVSGFIIWAFSLILAMYAFILAFINFTNNQFMITNNDLPLFIQGVISDKIGSIIIAILGFAVSIVSQITFPAPWRSYTVSTIFAIQQVIILFLPNWCVGFLGLFAIGTILTLDLDRKQQVSLILIKFNRLWIIFLRG